MEKLDLTAIPFTITHKGETSMKNKYGGFLTLLFLAITLGLGIFII